MTKIIPIKELKIKEAAAREIPKDIEEGVQAYWNELTAKYPGMFNGALYSVINMENDDGIVTITCEPSDYAHYKYSEIKDLGEYACRSMYAGCILFLISFPTSSSSSRNAVTKGDNLLVSVLPSSCMAPPINLSEGSITPPIPWIFPTNSEPTPFSETNSFLSDETSVTDIGKSYLVTNDNKYGFPFVFYSSLDSENILYPFDSFKKETGSNEVDRLIYFGKDDMDELEKYESGQDIGVVDLLKIIMGEL